jgi:hypothetical protein
MEVMPFDSEQFMSNSNNKVIEAKIINHFVQLKEHFIATVLLYKKYVVRFESLSHEVLQFFSEL